MLTKLHGHIFACRIDSRADKLTFSDTIVKYLKDKSIFVPTLSDVQSFKKVDSRVVESSGQVQISPILNTAAGKFRLPNLGMRFVPDQDILIRAGAAWAGEILLVNPLLLRDGQTVTDFVERLLTIN